MKLRNKRTGRVVNFRHIAFDEPKDDREKYSYASLAEFNEEWEDYDPKEPLIKEDKIRNIIRLWTKVNGVVELTYNDPENSLTDIFRNEISFNGWLGLKDGSTYTTKELCGESEE